MQFFDSYIEKIKNKFESNEVFTVFIEGNYGLGCPPPFSCNLDESVKASILPSQVGFVGYDRIIIYKSYTGFVAGVCLENVNDIVYERLQIRRTFFGMGILQIEKKDNRCYLKMLM